MRITIRNDNHAEIANQRDDETSDEIRLRIAAWLVSPFAQKLGLKSITFVFDDEKSDEQSLG